MLKLKFFFLVSNGCIDREGLIFRRILEEDCLFDFLRLICCCFLNIWEYEVDNCFLI